MQDLENKPEEAAEEEFSLELFLQYANLEELPDEFFRLLPSYCDKVLDNLNRLGELLPVEGEEDLAEKELEVCCIRASNLTHLSVPALYKAAVEPIEAIPTFKQYENILTGDFFFI